MPFYMRCHLGRIFGVTPNKQYRFFHPDPDPGPGPGPGPGPSPSLSLHATLVFGF